MYVLTTGRSKRSMRRKAKVGKRSDHDDDDHDDDDDSNDDDDDDTV